MSRKFTRLPRPNKRSSWASSHRAWSPINLTTEHIQIHVRKFTCIVNHTYQQWAPVWIVQFLFESRKCICIYLLGETCVCRRLSLYTTDRKVHNPMMICLKWFIVTNLRLNTRLSALDCIRNAIRCLVTHITNTINAMLASNHFDFL